MELTERYADALRFAWTVHGGQERKGSHIPYMSHVMAVSVLAMENGADEELAIAALLHDAVEDAPGKDGAGTLRQIREKFEERVAHVVEACSDTIAEPGKDKPEWRARKERYIAHLERADGDSLLVSLCDKVHNAEAILRDLDSQDPRFWERFTVTDPRQQLWYYESLSEVFQRRLPGYLSNRLRDAVSRISERIEAQAVSQ